MGSHVVELGEELVSWDNPWDLDVHGGAWDVLSLVLEGLDFFGGELCLVPVGPVGDLDLGVYNVCLSFLLGLVIVFGGCPSLFWVRGTLMVLDAVCCYVCEVLRMS